MKGIILGDISIEDSEEREREKERDLRKDDDVFRVHPMEKENCST